jgi:hypothetical protein
MMMIQDIHYYHIYLHSVDGKKLMVKKRLMHK